MSRDAAMQADYDRYRAEGGLASFDAWADRYGDDYAWLDDAAAGAVPGSDTGGAT